MKNISKKLIIKYFFFKTNLILILIFLNFISLKIYSKNLNFKENNEKLTKIPNNIPKNKFIVNRWYILKKPLSKENNQINWKKLEESYDNSYSDLILPSISNGRNKKFTLGSLNRSIVFNNYEIGPDISWLVPPGFKWTNKYKWDFSARGHNRRKNNEPFLGWNNGDAIGQFYFQPLNSKNRSFGINFGMRSIYSGSQFLGGGSSLGEGLSLGFRTDKKLSNNSGMAFGAEQLLHFDGLTDTGRDIYFTVSKGKWLNNIPGQFPLTIGTFGIGTGKMAEGNVKFLCSDLLGGSGTEVAHKRSLCWSPIFSIAKVFNPQFSTFFEYNSKWFLLGSSVVPFKNKPIRGTFAVQLSDHIDNYKVNNFNELKWVFRISLGF